MDKTIQKLRIKNAAIIAPNHKNALDFVLIMLLFWRRSVHCVIGETLYDRCPKPIRWLLKMLGAIRADRITNDPRFIAEAVDVLIGGGVVEIYPEGRFPLAGELMPFTLSTALIAVQTGVPVIPVYHAGRYGIFKREHAVIGTPIWISDYCKEINPSVETLKVLTKILEDEMAKLKVMCENNGKRKRQ